ncbi:MAG: hypothetical protein AB9917_02150 [Negativicutes bacterium]
MTKKTVKSPPTENTQPGPIEKWWIRGPIETCEFFNISEVTLANWRKRGMPQEFRGTYDLQKIIRWKYGTDNDKSAEARTRAAEAKLKEAKAEMATMDQAVQEGKYIEKSEVDRQWSTVGTQLKANIMGWVRTLTPQLAHQDMRSVEKIMVGAVYDLLEQLSAKGKYEKSARRSTKGA